MGIKRNVTLELSPDGTTKLDGVELTGNIDRLAFEADSSGSWLVFQTATDVGPNGISFDFPITNVKQYLGGGGSIEGTRDEIIAELEGVTAGAMGYGSKDAVGTAVVEWLEERGFVIGETE